VGDEDIGSPGRPVSLRLQVTGDPVHCRSRTRPIGYFLACGVNPSKCLSFAPAEMSNTPR